MTCSINHMHVIKRPTQESSHQGAYVQCIVKVPYPCLFKYIYQDILVNDTSYNIEWLAQYKTHLFKIFKIFTLRLGLYVPILDLHHAYHSKTSSQAESTYNLNIAIYMLITMVTSPRFTTREEDQAQVTHRVIIIITHSCIHQF